MVNFNATLIAQILNFLVLVFVLAKFAYKPVCNIMEERKNKLQAIWKLQKRLRLTQKQLKLNTLQSWLKLNKKLKLLLMLPAKAAQAAHDKIMADTKAEQDQVIATAKEAIALEQKKAMDEVRAQVINLSMIAASKIVEQKLGSEEDKKWLAKSLILS